MKYNQEKRKNIYYLCRYCKVYVQRKNDAYHDCSVEHDLKKGLTDLDDNVPEVEDD